MAEAILGVAVEKLSSLVGEELGLFLGLDREMEKLDSMFTAIKATLLDAETKQFSDKAIKNWLQKLRDVAHELDDIMDECVYEKLGLEFQGIKCSLSNQVQNSCLSSFHPKHHVFRYKIAKRMKRISERLNQITKEREQLHLIETAPERSGVIEWRQTTSLITEPQVYGRENEKNKIVDFLVGDASHAEDLLVYPIIGLGGLGKTTLAQLVFNHERVVKHFELRIWVCVSEDFSLKRMTKAIIEAASGCACDDLDLEPLQKRLQDLLQRKRYFLILDDVWNDEQENWQRLKSVLACGAKGASILVTTRLSRVATIMGTTTPHELSMMSKKNCWELFKHRAFGPDEVMQVELEVIGKEIVKKCGGVPLAAKALGSLLRFERKEETWLNVKENNLWSSSHDIMPALSLSYLNLPIKLRQCFAYCAIFPKDERIKKQHLIELWMANGFISSDGKLDVEDVGDSVWHELHWRSFFQDLETDELGKVTSFKLHDLVHDLAQFVAKEICCMTKDNDVTTLSERTHHLSEHRWHKNVIQIPEVKSLRSCIMQHDRHGCSFSSRVLKYYSLRVLDFVNRQQLFSSISHLKHLRYLNLCQGTFETLPESLCKLWNLQILKLDGCAYLQKLPSKLIQLKALQQLSLIDCNSLSNLPPQIGKLTSLRSLTMYFVGKKKGFHLAELGALKLKGCLHIKHLEKVKSVTDAKEANMSSKKLNKLWLSWDLSWARNQQSELQENFEQILDVLQPHTQQLQTLGVIRYKGVHFPPWISSASLKYLSLNCLPNLIRLSREDGENMFPRLSTLEITQCPKLLGLPCLPSINDLRIEGKCNQDFLGSIHKLRSLKSLRFIDNDELTCFPDGMLQNLTSLKMLEFCRLYKLEVLPTEIINLNAIQNLSIQDCNSLKFLLQGLQSLKTLEIKGCHQFHVSTGFQHLTCLEVLRIKRCREMEGLQYALQHMTALKKLELIDLPNLESLPDCFGHLANLCYLTISYCSKLRCLPRSLGLSSVRYFSIGGCKEMEYLHEALQHMTDLHWLRLCDLPNLESLPDCFEKLCLLHHLSIANCSKLRYLPKSLSLSNLKHLYITCCPLLEKRCRKNRGEDWQKIAHIPKIDVIRRGGVYYDLGAELFLG